MTISGRTKLIAHLGYPTESFKAPMIYNPYFERYNIDAVVVPMGCKAEDYPAFLKLAFKLSNIHGALVTMAACSLVLAAPASPWGSMPRLRQSQTMIGKKALSRW